MKAEMNGALWRLPKETVEQSDDHSSGQLEKLADFNTTDLGDLKK